ncbi:hypothetical protein SAMN05421813_11757 [Daejeonella rubra]|uniref:Uncharacterized protein n=1 Tax=Daejeonella rubra TaxID=990371 RepID=A0A1G9URB7_9SPHI|nr:hypothetical protein [Daejeonella rubra]SDM62469.1 hypothetical protein SAMN05421813_11757 [Daejeonella rubra]
MLFKDILDKKTQELSKLFDTLHGLAGKNQTHPGDLLLVHKNAFFNPKVLTWDNIPEKLSPYVIGPNHEGHSAHTHHDFIGEYIKQNLSTTPYEEYLQKQIYSKERKDEINKLQFEESISIQIEMLIYIKIWESDNFIKQLYEIVTLLNGEPYNWHFKIKETNRSAEGTGTRENIIRIKTRDRIKHIIPKLYDSFKRTYKTQIRNSIAHSQYSILGRNINLNNKIEGDAAHPLRNISFDEWVDIFHETIVIYSQLQRIMLEVNINYAHMSMEFDKQIEVRINRKDPLEEVQYLNLHYRSAFHDWGWYKE